MNALDLENCCLVMAHNAQTTSDEHFEQVMASGEELIQAMLRKKKDGVIISLIALDYPRPNATWRKRFAEAMAEPCAYKIFTAIVTTSIIIRGVMKTLSWIAPPSPNRINQIFATFDEAERWLEACRGEKLPALRALYRSLQPSTANLG